MSSKNSGKEEKPKEEKDKPEHQFSLLEEDDEFEEFPAESKAEEFTLYFLSENTLIMHNHYSLGQ